MHGVSVRCSRALNAHQPEMACDPLLLCDTRRLPGDTPLNWRTHQGLAKEAPCAPTARLGREAPPGARGALYLKPGGGLRTGPRRAVCPTRLQFPRLKLRLASNVLLESREDVNLPPGTTRFPRVALGSWGPGERCPCFRRRLYQVTTNGGFTRHSLEVGRHSGCHWAWGRAVAGPSLLVLTGVTVVGPRPNRPPLSPPPVASLGTFVTPGWGRPTEEEPVSSAPSPN